MKKKRKNLYSYAFLGVSKFMELLLEGLQKKFDDKVVLDQVDFSFSKGKIYSILGRNGAGKTTLFRCISEDLKFEKGDIFFVEDGEKRKLTFEDVGMVSASPVLPEFLTGYEFVNFFVKLNEEDLNGKSLDDYFEIMRIEEPDRHKLIKHYSYGMKNKLQLLCCLIRKPKIILLDEPLSSFDIIVSHEIKETLLRMKDNHIILMATHIMQLAQDISDEIVLLKQGKLEEMSTIGLDGKAFEEYIIDALSDEE